MNGVRRDHGISLEAVMKDNHLKERKTKVRIFKTLSPSRRKPTENDDDRSYVRWVPRVGPQRR